MELFSTHYHELTSLASQIKGLTNYHAAVIEENDKVTLLGEIQVDNLVINGNVNTVYSTSNGSQVAKQKVAEFWAVANYTEK